MKTCSKCKIEKTLESYSKSKVSKDGLASYCKECAKDCVKKWREKTGHDGRIVENKHCSSCDRTQLANEFFKDKSRQDGLANKCRSCTEEYKQNNREKVLKAQRNQNKKRAEKEKPKIEGRICSQCKEYKLISEYWKSKHSSDGLYSCCKECKRKLDSTAHRKEVKYKFGKKWREEHIEDSKKYHRAWDKNRRKTDINYKLRRNVMRAIVASVRKYNYYNGKLERLQKAIFAHLPYTAEEMRKHIEALWEPWMNWSNHAKYNAKTWNDAAQSTWTWNIDHIIPQSSLPYDSMDHENFCKCWALNNLRPLNAKQNVLDGSSRTRHLAA